MPHEEIYGTRDRSYSAWHRRNSFRRFIGIEKAQTLAMIDLDGAGWIEYDDQTKETLFLVEAAIDNGQAIKPSTVTQKLAARCWPKVAAYTVLYRLSAEPNPADPRFRDIDRFRIQRIWPEPETGWRILTPAEWAQALVKIREWCARGLDSAFDPLKNIYTTRIVLAQKQTSQQEHKHR